MMNLAQLTQLTHQQQQQSRSINRESRLIESVTREFISTFNYFRFSRSPSRACQQICKFQQTETYRIITDRGLELGRTDTPAPKYQWLATVLLSCPVGEFNLPLLHDTRLVLR